MLNRIFREFSEARQFARSLGLTSKTEWAAWAKKSDRPIDIPANPPKAYEGRGWQSWGDWLGTGNVATFDRSYRAFDAAREFARTLSLRSKDEWAAWAKSPDRPNDIPASPVRVYASQWKSWGDWLGTGSVATVGRTYREFEEARAHARSLKLRTFDEWRAWASSSARPIDMPAAPWSTYANAGWVDIKDWLGTVGVPKRPRRIYRSFDQARNFSRSLRFTSKHQWAKWAASEDRPADIPASPSAAYSDEWVSWGDWLGTGVVATFDRQYRPFAEARSFAHSLKLRGKDDWARWSKTDHRPADIPASPPRVYAAEWISWGDWLGTGTTSTVGRAYRSFEDARSYVRSLGLANAEEWKSWAQSSDRPADIPATPNRVYAEQWQGLGDWLGSGRIANQLLPLRSFDEARSYARTLGLKSSNEWREWAKSDQRPRDVPSSPDRAYKTKGWSGWGDWLGTDFVATFNRTFLPFVEARAFVHTLPLTGKRQWVEWSKSPNRRRDIPTVPSRVYKEEWRGWGDWLGTGTVATFERVFRSFEDARQFARGLHLQSKTEWSAWAKTSARPSDIPTAPDRAYRQTGWRDWGDWLGTRSIATTKRTYRPFEEARAHVWSLRLRTSDEWRDWAKSDKRPSDIPAAPWAAYRDSGWVGINDWLGSDDSQRPRRVYRSFSNARAFARLLKLNGKDAWAAWARTAERPADIPAAPDREYATDGWSGWADWLGVVNVWTKTALVKLLADLRASLPLLDDRELYIILQQAGALPSLRAAFGSSSPMAVLREIREGTDEALTGSVDSQSTDSSLETDVNDPEFALADEGLPEAVTREVTAGSPSSLPTEPDLPVLATIESLRVVDALANLVCGLDDEAAEYLVSNRVSALWERYISEGETVCRELQDASGGHWFDEIRGRFLSELRNVDELPVPAGWSFLDDNGQPAAPLAMQRRTAWAVRKKKRVGNWSGVGAGKTLSAVLASRVINAHCTVVICNNATVDGWISQIQAAYPDSVIVSVVDHLSRQIQGEHVYVVLNYEKFQGGARNHLVHQLLALRPDFIVFDEVQFVKQRDENVSQRRAALEALVSGASSQNPELRVLGMSATPVINNLLEAKKLLEIVTGVEYADLATTPTINNALAVHRSLMLNGFRYRPRYEIEMDLRTVTGVRNDLLEPLRAAGQDILAVEQLLVQPKLDLIRNDLKPGTIIYTHYVDGIVPVIREFVEKAGLRVGLYYGGDKSGLAPFKERQVDVLIGSSSVGTGVDGLQRVADRIIMLCLPWTGAEYEQIIGRIRRQRSAFRRVEIVVPQIVLDAADSTWSWDQGRMACIQFKRTLSDCALDGRIPEAVRISPTELLRRSREALEVWIDRVQNAGVLTTTRPALTIPLPPDVVEATKRRLGEFSTINQRWNTSRSETVHQRLAADSTEWYLYHTELRKLRERWPEDPCRRIAERLRSRPDWVIGDFGCGEGLLGKQIPNRVIGIDHVANDDSVIQADMSSTPLEDGSLDAAVFSLSLMSTNWRSYLQEAHRTLKSFGQIFIAEPQGRWTDRIQELVAALRDVGFTLTGEVVQRYDFLYVTAIKSA